MDLHRHTDLVDQGYSLKELRRLRRGEPRVGGGAARLPIWKLPLDRVQVTRPGRCRGGRRGELVHVRTNTLDPAEVVDLDGIAVTSIERTVLDIARAFGFMQAVVVADGAFARAETDRERAWGLLAAMKRWPGVRWTWAELDAFAPVAHRIRLRLTRG